METLKEYHYTYYSYEEWGRGYFGSRTCKCLPEEDVKYFGSFYDKTFKPTQKIILKSDYATRVEAIADEIILHDYYDVANNPHFANQAKQTCTKFSIYGTSHSKETKRKIGEGNRGKTHSKETREKLSKINKGIPRSEETRRKISEKKKGKISPLRGKLRLEKSKIKHSEAIKGEKNHNYGKKWWNDGEYNIIMSVECPGEGWVPGQGKWWNDGCGNSKRSIKCPGEGWVPGLMRKNHYENWNTST